MSTAELSFTEEELDLLLNGLEESFNIWRANYLADDIGSEPADKLFDKMLALKDKLLDKQLELIRERQKHSG